VRARKPRLFVATIGISVVVAAVATATPAGAVASADNAVASADNAVVTLNDGVNIGTLDTTSGATNAFVGSSHSGLYGVAFSTDGNLYGLEGGQLVRIDQTTGATTAIGSRQGLSYGLDQAPDGTMYAASYGGSNGAGLYKVNTATGGLTFVGSSRGAMDETFDCSGTLWGVDGGQLFSYDLATGAVAKTVTLTGHASVGAVMGLFVDAHGDMLATSYEAPTGKLFKVDPNTGALTLIGSTSGARPHGGDDVNACAAVAQQTVVGSVGGSSTFGQNATLTATLSAAGSGVANESVVFGVNGATVGTATTDSSGVATLEGVDTTGVEAGSYTGAVTATFAGDASYQASSGTGDLTVTPAAQTVRFTSTDPNPVLGGAAYTPSAAGGGSGNPVVFSVDATTTNAACAMADGTVTFQHAGTCVLDADQAGNANYTAAPTAQQQITVGSAAQAVTFTTTAPTATVGAAYAAAGTGGDSGQPVVFSADPSTTNSACSVTADGTVTFQHTGSCVIDADQAGNADYTAAPTVQQTVPVGPAATTTTVAVGPKAVTATVAATNPTAGTPTGIVQFSVNGDVVGTAPLDPTGTATLAYAVPLGATRHVAAAYAGSADFIGSAASTSRTDPTIKATVTSARPKTARGWYSGPVTVRFSCAAGSAQLTSPCPATVRLARSGAGQSITRIITTTDGGAAVATVTGLNIDRTRPSVRVRGARNGALYRGTRSRPTCAAADALSGVVRCVVRVKTRHDGLTHYTATATNGAGLSATTRGSYRVLKMWLKGVPWHNGQFDVRAGQTVTVLVAGRIRPRYEWAAPATNDSWASTPRGGHTAFYPNGTGLWQLRVTLSPTMTQRYQQWNLGARVGKTLHVIRIAFRR